MERSFAIKVKHGAANKHFYTIRHFHFLFVALMTNIKIDFKMIVNQYASNSKDNHHFSLQ